MDTLLEYIESYPDQVTALATICAVGISFISILLTVLTLWMQRVHNYKSVAPIAYVSLNDYENQVAVKIKNNGIGPLIIDQFIASNGQEEKEDIISWMPGLPNGVFWNTFRNNPAELAIPANEEVIMLKLVGDPNDAIFCEFRTQVRRALSGLTVRIKYKDIYGRKMPVEERTLTWFGRHF